MENKKSFILYCDQKEIFSSLSDSDCKELLMAIFDFETIDINSLSPIVKIAFLPIKNQLKRDSEKWEKEIKSRSDAGKKGMASRWHNKVITKHNSVIPVITKISDNVNVNVNDNVINNIYTSLEFLKNLPLEEKKKISTELGISEDKVSKKANELYEWCVINGKKKKNYYLFLRVCLRKDFVEPKQKVVSESANYIKL